MAMLSEEAEPSKVMRVSSLIVWSGHALAVGFVMSSTVIVMVSVAQLPAVSVTFRVTVHVLGVWKVYVGFIPSRLCSVSASVNVHL